MLIKARTIYAAGNGYNMRPGDDIIVGRGVSLFAAREVDGSAIYFADSRAPVVTILGGVFSKDVGVEMKSTAASGSPGNLGLVSLASGAQLWAAGQAVWAESMSLRLVNAGEIWSSSDAITLRDHEGASLIVNRGQILVDGAAVYLYGSGTQMGSRVTVLNSGLLSGDSYSLNDGTTAGTRWFIKNTGLIQGDINLQNAGASVVDMTRGRFFESVDFGASNDRFLPGIGTEDAYGGGGIDTLDFSAGGAVSVYLYNQAANTGRARGDVYSGFEIVLGSKTGGDRLVDDRVEINNDQFRGLGGNDTLDGGFGADSLYGGTGTDVLTGGAGTDFFVFLSAREGADRLTDFTAGYDQIRLSGAGFGLALAARGNLLGENLFHSGTTNRAAERDDRFIFRTGDATLWFDPDGTGRRGPVKIAALPANMALDASDIFIL